MSASLYYEKLVKRLNIVEFMFFNVDCFVFIRKVRRFAAWFRNKNVEFKRIEIEIWKS